MKWWTLGESGDFDLNRARNQGGLLQRGPFGIHMKTVGCALMGPVRLNESVACFPNMAAGSPR